MMIWRIVAISGAVAVLGSVLAVAEGRSGGGTTVKVTGGEMMLTASKTRVAAGPVTFVFRNGGAAPHELVVVRWNGKPGKIPLAGFKASEDKVAVIGEIHELAPGKSGRATLTLKRGEYVLLCNVPGHYQLGMFARLKVT